MLYIIGGAARSGKTLLARKAVAEKKIPYFPLDAFLFSIIRGVPQLGIKYENSFIDRSTKSWPIYRHLFNSFLNEENDFILEGDSILPSQVHELQTGSKLIKCCFVGYTKLTTNEKLTFIRIHHQGKADWTRNLSDEQMLLEIDKIIEFSKYLQIECQKYDIKYFDISEDFEGVHQEIFGYLFN